MSQIDFSKALDFLNASSSVLITCHTRCDGDSLGSSVGLAHILRAKGKSAEVILPSALPNRYGFLFDQPPRVIPDDWRSASLAGFDSAVVLDTSVREQLIPQYDFLCTDGLCLLVIDHHLSHESLGTVNIIDPSASSVGLLIAELAQAGSVELSLPASEALFTAIATDTGWFRFANTDSRTYGQTCRLVQNGVEPSRVYQSLYMQEGPSRVRLLARALGSLELSCAGRLACMSLSAEDFSQAQASSSDTEDMVNEPLRIASVQISVMLTQDEPGSVRVSLRSKSQLNVAQVAERFGGGGHSRAAGVQLVGSLDQAKQKIISALTQEFTGLAQ
ncbi:MAG: hypothetical protein GWP14_06610 [Actinobacteria bacterium]|nr:hypothetical protein [Actinomycetota bacterium]